MADSKTSEYPAAIRCGTCVHYRDVPNPGLGAYTHCVAHNVRDGWGPYTYMPVEADDVSYCWEDAESHD